MPNDVMEAESLVEGVRLLVDGQDVEGDGVAAASGLVEEVLDGAGVVGRVELPWMADACGISYDSLAWAGIPPAAGQTGKLGQVAPVRAAVAASVV
ncbi:hypothetical protein [Pseudofrankia sp. DC12]|uniref:hypothetical protein n=1 Tax=Pseudofrankia sp. DC12 TaxID=683315 RepID=UPI0005F7D269|nr:hypothetical protein [Pseudofrankia sp. DC12]